MKRHRKFFIESSQALSSGPKSAFKRIHREENEENAIKNEDSTSAVEKEKQVAQCGHDKEQEEHALNLSERAERGPTNNALLLSRTLVNEGGIHDTASAFAAKEPTITHVITQSIFRPSESTVGISNPPKLVTLVLKGGFISDKVLKIWLGPNSKLLRNHIELVAITSPGAAGRDVLSRASLLVAGDAMTPQQVLKACAWPQLPPPDQVLAVSHVWFEKCIQSRKFLNPYDFPHPLLSQEAREKAQSAQPRPAPTAQASSSTSNGSSSSSMRGNIRSGVTASAESSVMANLQTTGGDASRGAGVEPVWSMRPENKAKLACQISGTSAARNYNSHLTEALEKISERYTAMKSNTNKNQFKLKTYRKAIGILKALDFKVETAQQLVALQNSKGQNALGDSCRDICSEILLTGKSSKLQDLCGAPGTEEIVNLSKIWGVGAVTAKLMFEAGIKNITDARRSAASGTFEFKHGQRVGMKHYEDFQVKIPRSEVERMESYVRDHVQALVPGAQVIAAGSYRRGKMETGDIDILIAPADGEENIYIMDALLARMHTAGFLTDHLSGHEALTFRSDGSVTVASAASAEPAKRSYMGVCREVGREDAIFRRIDIKIFPRSSFAFALLHFTGCDYFNRSMRWYCHNFQYKGHTQHTLNEDGLFPCTRDRKRVVTNKGRSYVCNTEREIFAILGLVYKEPSERGVYHNEVDISRFKDADLFIEDDTRGLSDEEYGLESGDEV